MSCICVDVSASKRIYDQAFFKHMYPTLVHIPGARTEEHVRDCQTAMRVRFTQAELDELRLLKPVGGQSKKR